MLTIILGLLLFELICIRLGRLIYLTPFINMGLIVVSFLELILNYPNVFSIVVMYFLLFKLFSSARVFKKGKNIIFLKQVTFKSALFLDLFLIVSSALLYFFRDDSVLTYYYFFLSLAAVFAIYILAKTFNSKTLILKTNNKHKYTEKELPTISVLIPARNETDDLIRCLNSILASDYPKMEVIVLDDCSTEKRTPQIIRSFAHSGVKFIAGSEPKITWTAKNWAYQQLADASSGDYLIFLGVDVFVNEDTFTKLISNLIASNKKMASILPINVYKGFSLYYYFLQPMRYLLELILPNKLIHSAPAVSTLWTIDKKAFSALGGLRAVENSVMPEKYFARELQKEDKYIFYASDKELGIYSDKPISDQLETCIRLTYPTLKKRVEVVSISMLLNFLAATMPLLGIIRGILSREYLLLVLSSITIVTVTLSATKASYLAYRKRNPIHYIIVPISLLYTLRIEFDSMYKYEFSEVTWKERNVCIPVMMQYENV